VKEEGNSALSRLVAVSRESCLSATVACCCAPHLFSMNAAATMNSAQVHVRGGGSAAKGRGGGRGRF